MAIVNKIIHSSVVDGPGNRAAVFLQKCNFKCSYCHNPETIGQCVQCGACVEKCPAKALSLKDGKIVWDEDKCCECLRYLTRSLALRWCMSTAALSV